MNQPAIRRFPLLSLTAAAAAACLSLGCSDAIGIAPECDDTAACAPPLQVTIAMEGGAFDDLLSLKLSLEELRLLSVSESSDGVDGLNLLAEPRPIEVLSLDGRVQGLATGFSDRETIDRVRVILADDSPIARDLTGAAVTVSRPAQRTFTLQLPTPIVIPVGSVNSEIVVLELDVAASLTSAGMGAGLDFHPVLRASVVGAAEEIQVESVRGRASVSGLGERVTVSIANDAPNPFSGISLSVDFTGATAFFDEESLESVDREEFITRLSGPNKIVAVNGTWAPNPNGSTGIPARMTATSIRIVGLADTPTNVRPAIVEGRVVDRRNTGEIDLRVVEISGNDELSAALSMQADPETIVIEPSVGGLILDELGNAVALSELNAGARLRVAIDTSFTPNVPFAVDSIQLDEAPEYRGTLVVDAGQTVLFLGENEPAIESGEVLSSSTAVTLQPSGEAAVLDVVGRPELLAEDLLPPLRVAASGILTGDPSAPVLEGATLVVRPGRLDGIVSGVDAVGETFDASVEAIHVPFGGSATSPPFQFVLAPSCVFEGQVTSRADFFALFSSLQPGESLAVSVAGLGTVTSNEVIAFEIRTALE